MKSVRMRNGETTMRGLRATLAAAALLAGMGAEAALASDTTGGAQAQQKAAIAGDAPAPAERARIDRSRPGRRQPAFDLRRLTPPPDTRNPGPNRPM